MIFITIETISSLIGPFGEWILQRSARGADPTLLHVPFIWCIIGNGPQQSILQTPYLYIRICCFLVLDHCCGLPHRQPSPRNSCLLRSIYSEPSRSGKILSAITGRSLSGTFLRMPHAGEVQKQKGVLPYSQGKVSVRITWESTGKIAASRSRAWILSN